MRILKFLFFASLWILGIGTLIFIVGREAILLFGVGAIKSDYKALLSPNYSRLCTEQFSYSQDYFTQIRFTSSKEYNLEVVCADFIASPILIASKKLPPLLSKESFSSGFIIDERKLPFSMELHALGRHIYLYVEDQVIHSSYLGVPDLDYNQGPTSSCQAHNYRCCDSDAQSGLGEQIITVNDCPKSCYESCPLRPVFLSFNSQPVADESTRLVELSADKTIDFSYVLGNGKGDVFSGQLDKNTKLSLLERLQAVLANLQNNQSDLEMVLPITVKIDFGDGETWESTNLQDTVNHSYECRTRSCYFQVQISAQDARGVASANNELSKMIVKVNR